MDAQMNTNQDSAQGLVLVSIPYYRNRATIRKAVESVLSQTYQHLVGVVVNDGDPDPPWKELLNIRDPRLIQFELPNNEGRYFADAVAIDAINAPFFLMQDADDWSDPNRISVLLDRLKSTNADAAISGMQKFLEIQGTLAKWDTLRFPLLKVPLTPKYGKRASHCGLFKTELLRSVGGYYAGFRYGYDTLLVNFLCMVGNVCYVDEVLYNALVRPESLSHSAETGMNSRSRRSVRTKLEWAYREAFQMYLKKERGEITNEQLAAFIRKIRATMVDNLDEKRLQSEAERLRQQLHSRGLTHLVRDVAQIPLTLDSVESHPAFLPNSHGKRVWTDQSIVWNNRTISRAVAAELSARLSEIQPKRILECGSGLSTLFLAAFAASGTANVLSLEHDPRFYQRTRSLLRHFELDQYVDLRLARLTWSTSICKYRWYSAQSLGAIDFVVIDGPPVAIGREGSLFAIAPYLASEAEIWFMRGNSDHERKCLELWRHWFQFDLEEAKDCACVSIIRNVRRLAQN